MKAKIAGAEAHNAASRELMQGDSLDDRFAALEREEQVEALLPQPEGAARKIGVGRLDRKLHRRPRSAWCEPTAGEKARLRRLCAFSLASSHAGIRD